MRSISATWPQNRFQSLVWTRPTPLNNSHWWHRGAGMERSHPCKLGLANHPRFELLWLPTYCPRANPIERVFGDVHDKCTRNHKRKRLRDLVKDVERHVQENGPWRYHLSQLYDDPEVTAAVEAIVAETQPKMAA